MSVEDARDQVLRTYEGLVRSTAVLIVTDLRWRGVQTPDDDLDDIMQLLRMKVWYALRRFDVARARRKKGESDEQVRDRYVFMCVTDTRKDVVKRKRELVLMIEDEAPGKVSHDAGGARDAFDARYLSESDDQVFADIEEVLPLIPNTISDFERSVMLLLYRDYTHREIATRLDTSRHDVSSAVRSLRSKLGDWKPVSPRTSRQQPVAPAAQLAAI